MTCRWETLPMPPASTCTPTCTHSRTITTKSTRIFLLNSHDYSRSQRTILNLQLAGNETEARRGGVSREGWIPTQAGWLQGSHAPDQDTGSQPMCDGHNVLGLCKAQDTQQ